MALNVYFREDIYNTIRSLEDVNLDFHGLISTPETRAYRRGYMAALRAVGTCFGIYYDFPSRAIEGEYHARP